MKKIFLILLILMSIPNIVRAEERKQEFKNPLFYQQLIDISDDSMYLLTPTTKFFDLPIPDYYTKASCILLENEENFIKMRCDDCTNLMCDKHQERINTFEILPYNENTQRYYIRHRAIDANNGSVLRENLLWSDGIIAVAPSE